MTRSIAVLLLLLSPLLASPANADDEVQPIEICRDFSFIAKEIMTARQMDKPMSENLPNARDLVKGWADKYGLAVDMEEAEKTAADMVMDAYVKASYDIEGLQQDQIGDFENSYFRACYTELTSESEE